MTPPVGLAEALDGGGTDGVMSVATWRRELHKPDLGPAGHMLACCSLAAASGLLLPMAVEVVPSHVTTVLLPLVCGELFGPAGLATFAMVRC
jgi:hypothetical protein